jgi:hypothetical protein
MPLTRINNLGITDGTIVNADLASTVITGATSESTIAGGDQILIYDDSASALRKMTRTNFVDGLNNTPAFMAFGDGSTVQTILHTVAAEITNFNQELFDTHNAFNTATGRFTPTVAGKYFFTASIYMNSPLVAIGLGMIIIQKNNAATSNRVDDLAFINRNSISGITLNGILQMNGTTDFVSVLFIQHSGSSQGVGGAGGASLHFFGGYRLIGA